jgi:hypothetical protein
VSGTNDREKAGFRAWLRRLLEDVKNDPAVQATLLTVKWLFFHLIRRYKAEADKLEAEAAEHQANATLRLAEARAVDAATIERLVGLVDAQRERGQTVWISLEGGQPRLHIGPRCPGPTWVALRPPAVTETYALPPPDEPDPPAGTDTPDPC